MDKEHFDLTTVKSSVTDITVSDAESCKTIEIKNDPPPTVMAPRSDGVEIIWIVSGLRKGYVEYGVTRELGSIANGNDWGLRPASDEVIKVRLNELKAGTLYYYRSVTESFDLDNPAPVFSEIRTFRTLSESANSTAFCVWNDLHQRQKLIEKLHTLTPKSDFLVLNGDISNNLDDAKEVSSTFLYPGGVDLTKDYPLVILRGNHDLRGQYAFKVKDIVATPSGLPWFAFRSGPVAFICLDTGEDKVDNHPHLFGRANCESMRRSQAAWLEKIIELPRFKSAKYKIVLCHIPLRGTDESVKSGYDLYSQRSRDLWHSSLKKWEAQLIISGHLHTPYHLKATEALPYQQLVGGGPQIDTATLIIGKADENCLVIQLKNLDEELLHEIKLKPLV